MAFPVKAELYPIRKYTAADGLAQNFVNRLYFDIRGFLWICTNEGFSRFDGYEFINFGIEQGLPNRTVRDLLVNREGDYWLATNGGLVHFNPSGRPVSPGEAPPPGIAPMFTLYRIPTQGQDCPVYSLALAGDGSVWVGSCSGLYRLVRNGASYSLVATSLVVPAIREREIRTIFIDRDEVVWVGLSEGIIRYGRNGSGPIERFRLAPGVRDQEVSRFYQDGDGRIWAGAASGLYELNAGYRTGERSGSIIRQHLAFVDGLPGDWVRDIWRDPNGKYWVATDRGLARFSLAGDGRPHRIERYSIRNGLSDYYLYCVTGGSADSVWIGTANAGIMKWIYNGFTTYGYDDGLVSAVSIFPVRYPKAGGSGGAGVDRAKSILRTALAAYVPVSTPSTDLSHSLADGHFPAVFMELGEIVGDRFRTVRPNLPKGVRLALGWNQITFQDRRGDWWIPTQQGLYRFGAVRRLDDLATAQPKAIYTVREGLQHDGITRLFEDSTGRIWIASSSDGQNGLDRFDPQTGRIESISKVNEAQILGNRQVTSFAEERNGTIWLGLNGLLARYVNGGVELFNNNHDAPQSNILDLLIDSVGRLWIASTAQGLFRLDNLAAASPRFISLRKSDGLISNRVTSLAEDKYGRIYVGTGRGADQLDPQSGQIRHLTPEDGLALGSVDDIFRDGNDDLWFATTLGLSRYSPKPNPPFPVPPIYINGIKVGGQRQVLSALGETDVHLPPLPPENHQVEIEYVGISFASGDRLTYQSMLEGVDQGWTDRGTQRSINFANLEPGDYRLLIRAVNLRGQPSANPASLSFTISAHFWQTRWFYLLLGVLLILIGALIQFIRFRQRFRMEQIRSRISSDLHDEVGSSLSQIAILIELALRKMRARKPVSGESVEMTLEKVATTSREAVESMSDIVWAINPERDHLSDLVKRMRHFASETLTAKDILLDFQAPEADLPFGVEKRRGIYLIFKECINNIARHSGSTAVRVSIEVVWGHFSLRITDNGQGFPENREGAIAGDGNGMTSLLLRARSIGGELRIIDSLGRGTTITLDLPLK